MLWVICLIQESAEWEGSTNYPMDRTVFDSKTAEGYKLKMTQMLRVL